MKWLKKNAKRFLPLPIFLLFICFFHYFQSPSILLYKASTALKQGSLKLTEYYDFFITSKETLINKNEELLSEISNLKKENIELQILNGENKKIAHTLESLRSKKNLLGFGLVVSKSMISDNKIVVISDVMLKPDQLLLSSEGLVGRIVQSYDGFAYAMLVTDLQYGIPVMTARSREKGIASGMGQGKIKISFINNVPDVLVGDLIISSGDGLMHPYGIPVGIIIEMQNSIIRAKPLYESLDIVSIHSVAESPHLLKM